MITLSKKHLSIPTPGGNVPALLIADQAATSFKGTILICHRFGESKEMHHELYYQEQVLLTQAGFLLVIVDAPHHGERRDDTFDSLFPRIPEDAFRYFELLYQMIQEIPCILDHIEGWGHGNIGILGHSMGGFTAIGAIPYDERIKAVVTVVGSGVWNIPLQTPEVQQLLKKSPTAMPEKFFPCALLMTNASLDRTVPIAPVRAFVECLRPSYASAPERFCFIEYADCGHAFNTTVWKDFQPRLCAWFERYLV